MNRHVRWIAVLTILSLMSACLMMRRSVFVSRENEFRRAAAVRTRWIGLAQTGSCPAAAPASGWSERPLFPMKGLARGLQKSARDAGLDRFCVYEYHGAAVRPELPREIARQLRPGAEPDRVAMASSAISSLEEITWVPFFQRFADGVQILKTLPATSAPGDVRLAVLDSQPYGENVPGKPGRSEHGYALTHIAGRLACPQGEGSCAVQIAPRLALPVVKFDAVQGREETDETNGGFHGTYAALTKALWDEITSPKRPSHLVLNLSLGWDGEKFGGWENDPAKMTPDVQAVYKLLEFAAGQKVLVIAAAGNELSGPSPTGRPLLPAGWESRLRPGTREPLVYAVSGVDGQDHPLVNTRAQGEAPRVAYADHVVVPDFYAPDRPTATLTGTSVAAAVVSTTAALVWSQHPGMTPVEVMQQLDQSAAPLGRRPDFASASDPLAESVRRISVCRALSPAPCEPSPFPPPPLEEALSPFQAEKTMSGTSLLMAFANDTKKHPNLLDQPWVGPQPGADPCPSCAVTGPPDRLSAALRLPASLGGTAAVAQAAFKSSVGSATLTAEPDYKLRVEIPSTWAAGKLQDATLEIFAFNSRGRKKLLTGYSLATPLTPGATLERGVKADTPIQARLVFTLAPPKGAPPEMGPMSVDSPLFVEYRPPSPIY
jgi:hypothetical protein